MTSPTDDDVLQSVVSVLDKLGPFADDTPRSAKWRTANQLAAEVQGRLHVEVSPRRIEAILSKRHSGDVEAVYRGETPSSPIRRAMRPDLTTTEALWGSTRYLGHVWPGFPPDARTDRPVDTGDAGAVAARFRMFLSYCQGDSKKARELANSLTGLGIDCWMAELRIDQDQDIVTLVREALLESDALVALITRRFVGSLWCRTELHTALSNASPSMLVLDATDVRMVELMGSLYTATEADGSGSATRFGSRELSAIAEEIVQSGDYESVEKYTERAQGFAYHIPDYLGGRSVVNYPGKASLVKGVRKLDFDV